jgi:hypothetical protein
MSSTINDVFGYDGSGTVTTSAMQLPNTPTPVKFITVQNDPGNTTNLKVGVSSNPSITLVPGQGYTWPVANASNIWIESVTGTINYNWSASA